MKNFVKFAATPLIAVAMMTSVPMTSLAQQNNQKMTEEWNTPPAGTEQAQQGWRDGVEAVTLDKAAGRTLDPQKSFLYQHPKVKKGPARDAYLQNFEAGYKAAVAHSSAS